MDPSSPYAMARLVAPARPVRHRPRQRRRRGPPRRRHPRRRPAQPEPFPVAPPSPTCSVARATWGDDVGVGKTLVSSIDDRPRRRRSRPAARRGPGRVQVVRRRARRRLASGSAARRVPARRSCAVTAPSGRPTRTGSSPTCSPCELTARTGRDPGVAYARADRALRGPGLPPDRRARRRPAQKAALGQLSPADVTATTLAGDPITAILTTRARQRRRRSAA